MILNFKVSAPETDTLSAKLDGFTTIIYKNSVTSYENDYKDNLKQYPEMWPDPLISTDELIYHLHFTGFEENATALIKSVLEMLMPDHLGFRYVIKGNDLDEDVIIYERGELKKDRAKTAISNKKITYKLLTNTYSIGPVETEIVIWQ